MTVPERLVLRTPGDNIPIKEFTVRPQKFQCPILGSRGKLFYANCDETVPKVRFPFDFFGSRKAAMAYANSASDKVRGPRRIWIHL